MADPAPTQPGLLLPGSNPYPATAVPGAAPLPGAPPGLLPPLPQCSLANPAWQGIAQNACDQGFPMMAEAIGKLTSVMVSLEDHFEQHFQQVEKILGNCGACIAGQCDRCCDDVEIRLAKRLAKVEAQIQQIMGEAAGRIGVVQGILQQQNEQAALNQYLLTVGAQADAHAQAAAAAAAAAGAQSGANALAAAQIAAAVQSNVSAQVQANQQLAATLQAQGGNATAGNALALAGSAAANAAAGIGVGIGGTANASTGPLTVNVLPGQPAPLLLGQGGAGQLPALLPDASKDANPVSPCEESIPSANLPRDIVSAVVAIYTALACYPPKPANQFTERGQAITLEQTYS